MATEKKTTIFIGLVVGLQKYLDPLPQLGITQAFAIQNCGAFRGVMAQKMVASECDSEA